MIHPFANAIDIRINIDNGYISGEYSIEYLTYISDEDIWKSEATCFFEKSTKESGVNINIDVVGKTIEESIKNLVAKINSKAEELKK